MSQHRRRTLRASERFEIMARDRFACRYCGATPPDVQLVLDHVEPVSVGGECVMGNLVTACQQCNSGKSDRVGVDQALLERDHVDDLVTFACHVISQQVWDRCEDFGTCVCFEIELPELVLRHGVREVADCVRRICSSGPDTISEADVDAVLDRVRIALRDGGGR